MHAPKAQNAYLGALVLHIISSDRTKSPERYYEGFTYEAFTFPVGATLAEITLL